MVLAEAKCAEAEKLAHEAQGAAQPCCGLATPASHCGVSRREARSWKWSGGSWGRGVVNNRKLNSFFFAISDMACEVCEFTHATMREEVENLADP